MRCDSCNETIEEGEGREHSGKMLCEICYMDAVSPVRTCDPWAVYGAKTFEKNAGGITTLTPNQTMILEILGKAGGVYNVIPHPCGFFFVCDVELGMKCEIFLNG